MTCGIYKIENKDTGKVYVGSSKNIEKRWKEHKGLLRKDKHHSSKLQRAYNKYGKNKFIFEILEVTGQEDLLDKEQLWLEKTNSYEKGYNCSKFANRPETDLSDRLKFKHKDSIEETAMLVYQFYNLRNVFPKEVYISNYSGLKVDIKINKSEYNIRMFNRAIRFMIDMVLTGYYINTENQYRLNHISLKTKDIGWCLEVVGESVLRNKNSYHNKFKFNDFYSYLRDNWEENFFSRKGAVPEEIRKAYHELSERNPDTFTLEELCNLMYGRDELPKKKFLI